MAYYRKNKRRFDPRYFMNERLEELQLSDGEPDLRRPPEDEEDTLEAREKAFHPETIRQRLEKSFARKAIEDEEEAFHHVAVGADEQGEIDDRNRKFDAAGSKEELKEGCGDVEELPWVEIDGGKLTASNDSEQSLADIVKTGQAWKDMGIEIIGGRKDVLSALGVELSGEQISWLADEEPPLEE